MCLPCFMDVVLLIGLTSWVCWKALRPFWSFDAMMFVDDDENTEYHHLLLQWSTDEAVNVCNQITFFNGSY